jgi:hypothetical protein
MGLWLLPLRFRHKLQHMQHKLTMWVVQFNFGVCARQWFFAPRWNVYELRVFHMYVFIYFYY